MLASKSASTTGELGSVYLYCKVFNIAKSISLLSNKLFNDG